jgi:hypothetical protein
MIRPTGRTQSSRPSESRVQDTQRIDFQSLPAELTELVSALELSMKALVQSVGRQTALALIEQALSRSEPSETKPSETIRADGSWRSVEILRGERASLTAQIDRPGRYRLTWLDANGYPKGARAPEGWLDVRVYSAGHPLAPTAFNSRHNANGLDPDPLEFTVENSAPVTLEFTETGKKGDTFLFKLEPVDGVRSIPSGLVVYREGAETPARVKTHRSIVLGGGGGLDETAMKHMLDRGGNGDVVVLRMNDSEGQYARHFHSLGAHSVHEVVFDRLPETTMSKAISFRNCEPLQTHRGLKN